MGFEEFVRDMDHGTLSEGGKSFVGGLGRIYSDSDFFRVGKREVIVDILRIVVIGLGCRTVI